MFDSYRDFKTYDFDTQVQILRALNEKNNLKMSLSEFMEKLVHTELYVKSFGEDKFNCIGFKHCGGRWQDDIKNATEISDHAMIDFLCRKNSCVVEKGFTLKMVEDLEFKEANAYFLTRVSLGVFGHVVSIVNCENTRAIRFTEASGFVKVCKFKASRTGNDLYLFVYNRK